MVAKFFKAFSKATRQTLFEIDRSRRVHLSPGIYFQFPHLKVKLFTGSLDDVESVELSVADARAIFDSVKSAYDSMEMREIEVSGLWWRTDARDPDNVTIAFSGDRGTSRLRLKRTTVAAALQDFEAKIVSNL